MQTTFAEAIDLYLDYMPTRGYSLLSVRTARTKLRALLAFCASLPSDPVASSTDKSAVPWPDEGMLIRWQVARSRAISKTTLYNDATTMRTFMTWAARMRLVPENPARDISVPKRPRKLPRPLDDQTIHLLLNGWKPAYAKRDRNLVERDRTLVRLYMKTGLRRAELCSLDVGDVTIPNDPTLPGARQIVNVRSGKGDRDRYVPLPPDCDLRALVQGRKSGEPLFVGKRGDRLDPNAISYIFSRKVSPVAGTRVTPHMLRHSYATYLCRRGVSVRQIQELLGHSSLATTQQYLAVSVADLGEAISVLDDMGR